MQSRRTVKVFAPAKLNLSLHVTGRRPDGYHLLDSLVAFASVGDWLVIEESDVLKMRVTGPMAENVPTGDDNLVFRAAAMIAPERTAAITLDKYLPVAAGIGGGSADAGAAVRGLWRFWRLAEPGAGFSRDLLRLGADVPACVLSAPARMRGIGERVAQISPFPQAWVVLVNPGVPVATSEVFKGLTSRENPAMPDELPSFRTVEDLGMFLRAQRNDLEGVVVRQLPPVALAIAMLKTAPGALVARMSGSGATCFALFAEEAQARAAAARVNRAGWWVAGGRLLADDAEMAPEVIR